MPNLSRRRFLTISAVAATVIPAAMQAQAVHHWRGVALGADASITLAHPDAPRIVEIARAEIARLEAVFSLHTPGSALNQLNATGKLSAPPPELLECLGQCARLHRATDGLFDPTIQPLWAFYARHFSATGRAALPDDSARREVLAHVGFEHVRIAASEITLKTGMALSLNGIAQGYIADRVVRLLRARGLRDVLVNTGEFAALGQSPDGRPWQIGLQAEQTVLPDRVHLKNAALASSAPHGISFDGQGRVGHILNPKNGYPARPDWALISVTAPDAWLADGLSTAFCLMDRRAIDDCLRNFPHAQLAALIAA